MGADDIRDGVTINQNLRKSSAAMAAEIMNLPDLEGFLKMPGDRPVFRVKLDVKQRRKVAEIYIPRASAKAEEEENIDQDETDSGTVKLVKKIDKSVPYPFRSSGPHVRYLREKASKR